MITVKNYSGNYTLLYNDKKYIIEKVNYGYGVEWNTFEVSKSEVFGETKEWMNTYKTKKQAVKSITK